MGLSVCVAYLAEMLAVDEDGAEWFRESLARVNAALATRGLPAHVEPEEVEVRTSSLLDGFPYSWLHYLRRAYAFARLRPGEPLVPWTDEGARASSDPLIEEAARRFEPHLLCHSDAEGMYVPIDFAEVILDEDVAGAYVGSSHRLFAELVEVAPVLGIRLEGGELPDDVVDAINREVEEQEAPLYRERVVWLAMFEAARASLKHGTAIVFS